jgi:hypothetical protein
VSAHHFLLTHVETGVITGHALVCAEARYASVRWKGADRLDRRFVAAPAWKPIERELREGWSKGLVAVDDHVFLAVVPEGHRGSLQAKFLTSFPVDAAPMAAAQALDQYLHVQRFV